MLAIPAIDLRDGRCVRLFQGNPEKETVYSEDPPALALEWESLGAQMLHLVDLDGAFTGQSKNASIIEQIVATVQIPTQLGGGIRTLDAADRALSCGLDRLILGTLVVKEPQIAREIVEKHGEKILVGIDARDGIVAVKGWTESSTISAVELAVEVEKWGVTEIVYTDISRDGTLTGPNLKGLEELIEATSLDLIASGGISSLDDLSAIKPYGDRVRGVIIGKALYAGQFNLPEAIELLNSK